MLQQGFDSVSERFTEPSWIEPDRLSAPVKLPLRALHLESYEEDLRLPRTPAASRRLRLVRAAKTIGKLTVINNVPRPAQLRLVGAFGERQEHGQ